MIRFLNSLEVNPSVAKYAPWFVEDISKLDIGRYKLGTKIYGHGSHRWGLDVDMSVPTLSEQEFKGKEITGDVPLKGYVPTRKVKMSVSDKRRGSKESWNFDNLGRDVSKIDIDACINFIAHCLYGPGAGTEFIVEYIFIDEKIIAAIKQKLKQDIKAGKRSKRWLSRKIFGTKVRHEKNHFHHFHVRLYGIDENVKKYISDKKNIAKPDVDDPSTDKNEKKNWEKNYESAKIGYKNARKRVKELYDEVIPAIRKLENSSYTFTGPPEEIK